jgi:hypothetical protein
VARASKIPGGGGSVTLNREGMGELLKSQPIANVLRQRMTRVQSALAGSELEVNTKGRRARVKVIRGSDYDEANTGDMARALDLAGGQRGYKVKTNKPKPRRGS